MTQQGTPPTDPGFVQEILLALGQALSALAKSNPVTEALYDILPPLVRFIVRKIDKNEDPRTALYAVILEEADTIADDAERLKFGAERPTKP
jgi:hypothetical protein